MLDKSTHVDCDDILHQYEQKLRAEEQIAELQQQISERDEEIEQLRRQLVDDCQLSAQRLEDTQRQVG